MQRFLDTCASYIIDRFAGFFPEICLVFPNRRAGTFFSSYLRKKLQHPVIGPKITTIQELMVSFSELLPADRLKLNAVLYETYREHTGTSETFDDFWFWGEILLSDFDDIDKYMVNAPDLFRNLSQLKDIEHHFDYLTEEQKKLLEQFWGSLRNWEEFDQERNFISIWEKLADIYKHFRERLSGENIGYDGMLVRDGMERMYAGMVIPEYNKYLFVGLNALNPCEKSLFRYLKERDQALFFWDYDDFYMGDTPNNAGKFIRENLDLFPAPGDFTFDSNQFGKPKSVELVAVPSGFGQAQVIPGFFNGREEVLTDDFDDTAVVLADESLLFPVLGAIPGKKGGVNITMGYSLRNSPVVSFILLISDLLRNTIPEEGREPRLYFRIVAEIISHRLISGIEPEKVAAAMQESVTENRVYLSPSQLFFSELHRQIFTLPTHLRDYTSYFLEILRQLFEISGDRDDSLIIREMIAHVYMAVEKLGLTVQETNLSGRTEVSPLIYLRLLHQYLGQLSVPFEGEPLTGIQVMGILETRCLDFDNLLIIGLNEEIWPHSNTAPSMIPFSLKRSFGLPGPDEEDAMYAYYFYRLIQRVGRVTLTWNTVKEGLSGGELSRFGYQLMLQSPHVVVRRNQELTFSRKPEREMAVHSDSDISGYLLDMITNGKPLSPSAIITYLTCSLKFYFRYVAGLKEPDEVTEEIDRQTFGNIFHKAVEILYKPFSGGWIDREKFRLLRAEKANTRQCIRQAFTTEYFHRKPEDWGQIAIEGKGILFASALETYISNLLETDAKSAPILIHHLENSFDTFWEMEIDGIQRKITIGGKIDRVDETNEGLRVIDYKTGFVDKYALSFLSVEELFDRSKKQLKKEAVQALIYSCILKKSFFPGKIIHPAVFAILKLKDESFSPRIRMNGNPLEISQVQTDLEINLKSLLREIFSVNTIFSQTIVTERCRYCPYNGFCGRW